MNDAYKSYSAQGIRPQAVIFDLTKESEAMPFAEDFAEGLKKSELKVVDAAARERDTITERFKVLAGKMLAPAFNCVVITDRDDGVNGALTAGMVVIGFKNRTMREKLGKADMVLTSFEGLDEHVVYQVFAHARKIPL